MSQNPPETISNSTYDLVFENALKAYKKKTGKDLASDPLLQRLEPCNSPDVVLGTLRDQIPNSDQSGTRNGRFMDWLDPTVNVLLNFSETIGGAVNMAYPPAGLIITGINSLLSAVQAASASQDAMIALFELIGNFFRRLEAYIGLPQTAGMMEIIVKVMAEVLIILGLATREIKQGKIKRFLKKLIGRSDIKDALQRLDNLMQEESRMAAAQGLKATHKVEVGIRNDVQGVGDRVNDVIDGGERLRGELQQVVNDVGDQKRKQLRQDLEKWLSPPDPSTNYNIASGAQHKGTATWFTDGSTFTDWKESGSLLWVHGKPGSGKSVLTSAIIQDINAIYTAGSESAHLAYFFFDFKDTGKQDIRALLSSLIVQLSNQSPSFYDLLLKFYSDHHDGSQQPNPPALVQCLGNMLRVQEETPIYLIIDALDECPDTSGVPSSRERVLELVKDLIESHLPILRLCVTSRPEIDIRNVLESLTSTSNRISLHDEDGQRRDIVDYVSAAVSSDIKMKRWREEDKRMVVETLSERADGMFRWVFCQLETLRHCLPPSVRQTLAELPPSLDETYERILQEIPRANRVHTHRLLQCLTVAERPLTVEELAEVLAIDFPAAGGIPKLKEGFRWEDQEQAVLSACSSLIIVVQDEGPRLVQFSHFSVKEFLTSDRLANKTVDDSHHYHILLDSAHAIMAQACLGVLLRFDDQIDKEAMESYPLVKYAVTHVTDHADFENVISQISYGIDDLFDPDKPYFDRWCRLRDDWDLDNTSSISLSESGGDDSYHDQESSSASDSNIASPGANPDPLKPDHLPPYYSRGWTPLHCIIILKHFFLIQHLISKRPQDLHTMWDGITPLHLSVSMGDVKILQLILGYCVDVDVRAIKGWTLLHIAARDGHFEPTRMLVERRAAIDARDYNDRTPLYCTMYDIYDEAPDKPKHGPNPLNCARFLLEHGADVDAQDNRGLAPLHRATDKSSIKAVQLLYEHGANIHLRSKKGETVLHRCHSVDIARLLIDHGADVGAQDNKGSTPLHLAVFEGYFGVAQLLLERGANVNLQNNESLTPLHSPLIDVEILELLLKHGANVHVQNKDGLTPLHLAASRGNARVAKLLSECGANVDVQDNKGSTPLHLAVSEGHFEVFELLLECGANINVQNNEGSTPLHPAYSPWIDETTELLLKDGANTDEQRVGLTLLHLAALAGSTRVAKLLLKGGANVDVQNNKGSTPLHLALSGWNNELTEFDISEVTELLLEHGANVHVQNKDDSTPLHLTALLGNTRVAKLLFERGANVDVQDNNGSTPLHLALSPRNDNVTELGLFMLTELLLEHGANVLVQNNEGKTPLQVAPQWAKDLLSGDLQNV